MPAPCTHEILSRNSRNVISTISGGMPDCIMTEFSTDVLFSPI